MSGGIRSGRRRRSVRGRFASFHVHSMYAMEIQG